MFEDALVFNPAYRFLWPISAQQFGFGVLQYTPDLYGIADTEVLLIGVFAVILCAILRTLCEGRGWIKKMFGFSQQA